jgi:hypothetical protein
VVQAALAPSAVQAPVAAPPASAPAAPTPTQYTAEQVTAYQQQVQAHYQAQLQAAQQQVQADMALRVALARAGVHHDGYAEFLAGQYNGLAPTTRPRPEQWIETARQQHAAMFAGPGAAAPQAPVPSPGGPFPPPSIGAPPTFAAPSAPPPAPPGWVWTAQGWVQDTRAAPPAASFSWPTPVPQPAPPAWPPAPAPTFAAPPAPAGWPQLVRSNPDQGAPSGTGSPVDPPITADLINRMDQATFARRWPEIDTFMRARPRG